MALLTRKTEAEKEAERRAKADEQARAQAARAAAQAARAEHLKALTKWEYQVKRIGEDKQKGLSGSTRMEQIFNAEGGEWLGTGHDQ
jgi:hypothetical protein